MGFFGIKKPFQKDSVNDYEGVLVPLANANRHPTVAAEYERRRSADQRGENTETGKSAEKQKTSDEEGVNASIGEHSMYTIEGLRAEINNDVATTGGSSAYDLKSKVINKAIQDIGMGRYNWELFVLCGFGWFADK